MQLCQNWRPLLASLETYIETSGDLSPICYLSNKYATESPAILGAALTQIGALLGQAQQIIHQVGSGEPAVDAALPEKAAADVECAPDGSWLRVGNRALRRIRGRQQDFVLTMVEAYKRATGDRRSSGCCARHAMPKGFTICGIFPSALRFWRSSAKRMGSAGSSPTLPSNQLRPAKCERGSIQRPVWPGNSIKPKCW